jgi:hypothetical protein
MTFLNSRSLDYAVAVIAGTHGDLRWVLGAGTVEYGRYVEAYNVLATRNSEIRDWCRGLLTHTDHDARECGAFLLGQLGNRGQLGDAAEIVVAELGTLTRRPIADDPKRCGQQRPTSPPRMNADIPARAPLCGDGGYGRRLSLEFRLAAVFAF